MTMKLRAAALALIVSVLLVTPGLAVTVTIKTTDGSMTLNASQIDVLTDRFVAKGQAHVHWIDKVKKLDMDADAEKMVVTTMPAPAKGAKKLSGTAIKNAVFSGPVNLVYVITDASGKSTITAKSDNADFDGVANIGHMVGNVKIVNDNPAMFSAPATMNCDKATVNLKPSGPDDFRFRVETLPGSGGIVATPKAQKAE